MRKLASIVTVDELVPIEGADFIEIARLKGWQCIVKKGDFREGDLGVYFEIDSVPPDDDRFRFLWDKKNEGIARPEKYRIRTMKLRGKLSQGLLMPVEDFPELYDWLDTEEEGQVFAVDAFEGDDVTERLGVTKYDPPIPVTMGSNIVGHWPFVCPKTDQERIQNVPEILDEFAGVPWVATLKYDGTSMSVGVVDGDLRVASRNYEIGETEGNVYWEVARSLGDTFFEYLKLTKHVFQGELCGPGIQGNPLGLTNHQWFIFDIWDGTYNEYLSYEDMSRLCQILLVERAAPIDYGTGFTCDIETLLTLAEGKYESGKEREGIVIRPIHETIHSPTLGGRLSFKVISNRYLLKEKD